MNFQISEKDFALIELFREVIAALRHVYTPQNTLVRVENALGKLEKLCTIPMSTKHAGDLSKKS